MPTKNSILTNTKYKNPFKVFSAWTDWNRKGAEGIYGGIGWYRIINPIEKLENTTTVGKFDLGGERRKEIAEEIGKNDIIYIKYVDNLVAVNHLLTLRDVMRKKLIVDIDDNVFKVHPDNYVYTELAPGTEPYKTFQYLFREADALVCSTEPLADAMRAYNPNVYVIPNAIDQTIWKVPIKKNSGKKVKIGWVNGPTHEQDVQVFYPVVKEIVKRYPNVEFHHIGWMSEIFEKLPRQEMVFGTQGYKEFPKFLAGLGMDILVAPLIDDEFNRGKSNIKFLEAAMCEVPTVCSDVYPYSKTITHGKDGYLAKSSSEWIKHLSELIESKELRTKIGKEAKKTALTYDIEKFLPEYVRVFEKVCQPEPEVTVVVTRRKDESDEITLRSIEKQNYPNIKEIIRIEDTFGQGANKMRNIGISRVKTPYVLFSDNDIDWKPWAVQKMMRALKNSDASYSFGAYLWKINGKPQGLACNEAWSAERLKDYKKGNIVSTMALVRTNDFTGFDESVKRLQDWDAWLTMLENGKTGVHCGDITFETEYKQGGISASKETTYQEALDNLVKKHNL